MIEYLVFVVVFVLGAIFGRLSFRKKCVGVLRMDSSDPDEAPYLFLEMTPEGMNEIYKEESVCLRVDLKGIRK